jgi:hypothetical protein
MSIWGTVAELCRVAIRAQFRNVGERSDLNKGRSLTSQKRVGHDVTHFQIPRRVRKFFEAPARPTYEGSSVGRNRVGFPGRISCYLYEVRTVM